MRSTVCEEGVKVFVGKWTFKNWAFGCLVWWRLFSAETYDSANSNFVHANIFALTQSDLLVDV